MKVNSEKRFLYFMITAILILCLSVVGFAEEPIFKSLNSCSTIIVGKDASVDGSTIIAGVCDTGSDSYNHLTLVPAKDYKPGAKRSIVTPYCAEVPGVLIGSIPQVEHTYAYIGARVFGLVNNMGLL